MALDQFTLLFVSFFANLLSSLSGGGAGLVQLPALIFFGLPFSLALATHKVATVALGAGATLRHLREGHLEWSFIFTMLLVGIPGVIIGAHIILHIPDRAAEIALGSLTLALGAYSVLNPGLGKARLKEKPAYLDHLIGGLVLFLIAILNGSLTSGTGLFVTLWLVRWYGLSYLSAVAHTLVLVGIAWNGTGAITLGLLSEIYWPWVPTLVVGALLGGYAGAHLAISKGNKLVKRAFEALTIIVGIKLLVG